MHFGLLLLQIEQFLHIFAIRGLFAFLFESARDRLVFAYFVNALPNDVDVAFTLLPQIGQSVWRHIERVDEVVGLPIGNSVQAHLVRHFAESEIVELANDAAFLEDRFGGALQSCYQFGLCGSKIEVRMCPEVAVNAIRANYLPLVLTRAN